MLAALLEGLFQIVLELIFEIVGELLAELGLYAWKSAGEAAVRNPVVVGLGYVVLGAILGGLSFWFFPGHLIQNETLRFVNGAISPLLLGLSLCLFSWIIKRRDIGEGLFRRDKFLQGVVFALAYSLTRFYFVG